MLTFRNRRLRRPQVGLPRSPTSVGEPFSVFKQQTVSNRMSGDTALPTFTIFWQYDFMNV